MYVLASYGYEIQLLHDMAAHTMEWSILTSDCDIHSFKSRCLLSTYLGSFIPGKYVLQQCTLQLAILRTHRSFPSA